MNVIGNIHTDIGNKKKVNQDAAFLTISKKPFGNVVFSVLCDGMGGLDKGEIASSMVVNAFIEWLDDLEIFDLNKIKNEWSELLQHLNKKLCEYGQFHQVTLGTTITAMITNNSNYLIVNVGDSRVYEIADSCHQITQDHTVVAEAVSNGSITEEEAKNHPKSHILSQCIGVNSKLVPDFFTGIYNNQATYLLCSDGFVNKLSNDELLFYMKSNLLQDLKAIKIALYNLTETVKLRGELDNITAIAITNSQEIVENKLSISTVPCHTYIGG